jgi:hypothetical protein
MSRCTTSINLEDTIPGCKNFKWHEFLYLPSWDVYAFPDNDIVRGNIIKMAGVLQEIRDYFNRPITITSGYRPKMYNDFISGATYSSHITGRAVDFRIKHWQAEDIRFELVKRLVRFDIRMENHRGNWVHIDLDVHKSEDRYFKP